MSGWRQGRWLMIGLLAALLLWPGCTRRAEPDKEGRRSPEAASEPAQKERPAHPQTAPRAPKQSVAESESYKASHSGGVSLGADAPKVLVDRLLTDYARTVTVSRGGRYAAVVVGASRLQQFDASRGRLVAELDLAPWRLCRGRPFDPGVRRALVRRGRRVALLDLSTLQPVMTVESAAAERPRCTLSGNGLRVVLATTRKVQVFDTRGQEVVSYPVIGLDRVDRALTDGQGRTLVLMGRFGGRELTRAIGGRGEGVWRDIPGVVSGRAVLNAEGTRLAGSESVNRVALWDTFTGALERRFDSPMVLNFVAHDRQIVLADPEGVVIIRQVKDGTEVRRLQTYPALRAAGVSPDGTRLLVAAGGDVHRLAHWNLADGQRRFERIEALQRVAGLVWTRSTGKAEGTERLEVAAGRHYVRVPRETGMPTLSTRAGVDRGSDDGVRWAGRAQPRYAGRDVLLEDLETGELAWSRRLEAPVLAAAMTADSAWLVSLDADGSVLVFDALTGEIGATREPADSPVALTSLAQADEVLSLSAKGSLRRWRASAVEARGHEWVTGVPAPRGSVLAAARDMRTAVAVGRRRAVTYALGEEASVRCQWRAPLEAYHVAVSADGDALAVSDGLDVVILSACGEAKAKMVLGDNGSVAVLSPVMDRFRGDGPLRIRYRKGLETLGASSPAVAPLRSAAREGIPF